MPTYTYRCPKCETAFEEFHGIRDNKPRKCPKCGARAVRVPAGGAGLLFKGSGFYITDYRSKSYREKARKESGGGGSKESGGGGSKESGGGGSKDSGGSRGSSRSGSGGSGSGSSGSTGKKPSGD